MISSWRPIWQGKTKGFLAVIQSWVQESPLHEDAVAASSDAPVQEPFT
jgi:hypothetical protein